MYHNRINGFYTGYLPDYGETPMTLDERNEKVNEVLETQYSQLNASIEAFEEHLRSMALGRNAIFKYNSRDCGEGEEQKLLGMVKLNGQWRLCHASHFEYYNQQDDEPYAWKPLVESSLEDRIWASKYLLKLREAVVESKEKLVPILEQTIQMIAESLPPLARRKK